MVTHISSLNHHRDLAVTLPTPAAKTALHATAQASAFAGLLSAPAPATTAPQAAAQVSAFAGLVSSPAPAPAAPAAVLAPAVAPAPTAESVFGPNPWMTDPGGHGPNGLTYNYNPIYFATADTAAQVAQMAGGKVVQTNPFSGGPFTQNQPNEMVELPNGNLINPGLVASFYTHGYPQAYVNQLVANEFGTTAA